MRTSRSISRFWAVVDVGHLEHRHVAAVAADPLQVAAGGGALPRRRDHLEERVADREHRIGQPEVGDRRGRGRVVQAQLVPSARSAAGWSAATRTAWRRRVRPVMAGTVPRRRAGGTGYRSRPWHCRRTGSTTCPSSTGRALRWPDGARVALWVAPNVEHYEYLPPRDPARNPWTRTPHPEVQGYGQRDYGNRVGFWRMAGGPRPPRHPGHGLAEPGRVRPLPRGGRGHDQPRLGVHEPRHLQHPLPPRRSTRRRSGRSTGTASSRCAAHTGERLKGMLGPAVSNSVRTPDLMAEAGLHLPRRLDARRPAGAAPHRGRAGWCRCRTRWSSTTSRSSPATSRARTGWPCARPSSTCSTRRGPRAAGSCACPSTPTWSARPHRVRYLDEVLEYVTGHDDVWLTTAGDIAEWFLDHHYDEFVAHARDLGWRRPVPAERRYGMDHDHYEWSPLPTRPAAALARRRPPGAVRRGAARALRLPARPRAATRCADPRAGCSRCPFPTTSGSATASTGTGSASSGCSTPSTRAGVPPTVAVDALTAEHYPWLMAHLRDRGAELMGHGVAASPAHHQPHDRGRGAGHDRRRRSTPCATVTGDDAGRLVEPGGRRVGPHPPARWPRPASATSATGPTTSSPTP